MATSPEYAARIVAAVTGKSQEVARVVTPSNQTVMADRTNSFEDDACCGRFITKAAREGKLTENVWFCGNCGEEWRPTDHGVIRHWAPVPLMQIL